MTMKKIIILALALLLVGSIIFAAEETSRLKLSATVAEGPDNSGIKIASGDRMDGQDSISTPEYRTYFDNLFLASANDLAVDAGDGVTAESVEGLFSVLVFRSGAKSNSTITVNVSATPMKNEDGSASYLPYKITEKGSSSAVINTLGNPAGSTSGASYTATTPPGTAGIRDIRVFEYLIPKATNVEYGKYSANVFFSIIIE